MHETALQQLAIVTGWMRARNLPFYELVPPKFTSEHAVGVAVRWPSDDFTLVSVPVGSEHEAHMATGVLRDVKHNDKLALLEVCNELTADGVTPAVSLHEREDVGWCVHVHARFPVDVVQSAPQYFATLLQGMAAGATQARDALEERGLTGNRFAWDGETLLGLLNHAGR